MKKLYFSLLFPVLLIFSVSLWAQTTGRYDVRFVISSAECVNDLLYLDVEVRANDVASTFFMADQNYKFTYNREAINNPRVTQELGFSGTLPHPDVVNYPSRNQPYNPHSTGASIDPGSGNIGLCILNITWNPGINGVTVPSGAWSPVSRIEFDIVDPTQTQCLNLTWRDKSNTFHFTNITEVEAVPPPNSTQTDPFTTSANVAEGLYVNVSDCLSGLCSPSFPVEWLSFTGEREGDDAILEWTVASELNNDHYVIQRSTDGQVFSEIGTKGAVGNTDQTVTYSYLDKKITDLKVPLVYYRLMQVDADGGYSFSNVVEVFVTNDLNIALEAYPNPATEFIFIEYVTQAAGDVTLEVMNTHGQVVWVQTFLDNARTAMLDTRQFAKGTYMVRASNEYSVETFKFVVQ